MHRLSSAFRSLQSATSKMPGIAMQDLPAGNQRLVWRGLIALFVGLAIWPLWSVRFPPLQDYPEHLFHAQLLRSHDDPAWDDDSSYECRIRPTYATFFLTTLFFARFVPIEIAGKLSLSLYPLLVALLVARLGRRPGREPAPPPWAALLFFPLVFNQQYFLGIVNYFLSLPILLLALLDDEDFRAGRLTPWPCIRQALWQGLLFITHPLSFLVYVSMTLIAAVMTRRQTDGWAGKRAASMAVTLLLFGLSWLENGSIPPARAEAGAGVAWISPVLTANFTTLMLSGMRGWSGPDPIALVLWGGMLAAVVAAWRTSSGAPISKLHAVYVLLGIAGMFFLPFRIGAFSYINVRIGTLVCFLLALLVAQVPVRGWLAYVLVGCIGLCMVDGIARQARLSAEIDEIVPVVREIPPNSRILPLVFDRGSPELDRFWFDFHLHDHDYYHVLVGGGYSPYLLRASLHPVRYKSGAERPAPGEYEPGRFSWEEHAADYRYFLVRGMPDGLEAYLSRTCDKLTASGHWVLFRRQME